MFLQQQPVHTRAGGWGRRSTSVTRPHLDDDPSAQASPRDGYGRRSTNITQPAQLAQNALPDGYSPRKIIADYSTSSAGPPRVFDRRAVITGTQLAAHNPGRDPEYWVERGSPRVQMGEYHIAGGGAQLEERAAAAAAAPAPAWVPAQAGRPPPVVGVPRWSRPLAPPPVPALRLDSVVPPAPPLGGAISERMHRRRDDYGGAPLVHVARPSTRQQLKARLIAPEVEPVDALDEWIKRRQARNVSVRATIRDSVVGLRHEFDLMKGMTEGQKPIRPRERIGRR